MKKLLSALALVLALTGCANNQEEQKPQEPAAIQTLDAATFATELTNTEFSEVRYDLVTSEKEIEGRFTEADAEFVQSVSETIASFTLVEVTETTKFTTAPDFYIDLHASYASNYVRFGIYHVEDLTIVEIRTNEGMKQYTVTDLTQVETLYSLFIAKYIVEA